MSKPIYLSIAAIAASIAVVFTMKHETAAPPAPAAQQPPAPLPAPLPRAAVIAPAQDHAPKVVWIPETMPVMTDATAQRAPVFPAAKLAPMPGMTPDPTTPPPPAMNRPGDLAGERTGDRVAPRATR